MNSPCTLARAIGLALFITGCGNCSNTLPDLDDAIRDYSAELPVFPGAQGFGSATKAGRGGEIVRVTTLANRGPGSLREALLKQGPRTIIFEVAGVISTQEHLEIKDPFVTVAGQTAPAPGITIYGAGLTITTHDVLVQHLHVRPGGDKDGPNFGSRDAIEIRGDAQGTLDVFNVIIDHCSMSWGTDETMSTWYKGVHDVTVSHSIIAETLDDAGHPQGDHSKGLLVGDHTRRFSILRNLLIHNNDRNPHVKGDASALFVNNLVYNYGRWPLTVFDNKLLAKRGPSLVSAMGNVFIAGEDSPPEHSTVLVGRSTKEGTAVYLKDNLAKDLIHGDACSIFETEKDDDDDVDCLTDTSPVMVAPLTIWPAAELEMRLLDDVGAFPAQRGAIDARHIKDARNRTGRIIDSTEQVGGPPAYPSITRVLSPPDEPLADEDGDGYTNLEEWLHTFPKE